MNIPPEKSDMGLFLIVTRHTNIKQKKESQALNEYKKNISKTTEEKRIKLYRSLAARTKVMRDKTFLEKLAEEVPEKNVVEDTCNWTTLKHNFLLRPYNYSKVKGKLKLRKARKGERFHTEDDEYKMSGKEIVLSDEQKILSVVPVFDSPETKVGPETEELVLIGYGLDGISKSEARAAMEETINVLKTACNARKKSTIFLE